MNASASFFSRRAAALWTLAFLVPGIALLFWLFREVRPEVFLSTLYAADLPIAFRLPAVALAVSALVAWALWRLREAEEPSPSRCIRSPRRILGVALLSLALLFSLAFGNASLWAMASLIAGVVTLQAALGLGLVLLRFPPLNLHERIRQRPAEEYFLASALGLGLLALIVFVLGSVGFLQWYVMLTLLLLCGFISGTSREQMGAALERAFLAHIRHAHPFALGVFFFTLAWFLLQSPLITATSVEYDVLEYHLAAPLQYLRDGRITFLRENVYAAMPSSGEMLSLIPLSIFKDPYRGLMGARVILWACWALSALGVYALTVRLTQPLSTDDSAALDLPVAPLFAAALFAIAPLGSHLAADFYVEHPQTLFHLAAIFAACVFFQERRAGVRDRRSWLTLAGLLAGAACATKYSALLFTLGPLLVFVPLLCALYGSFFEGLRAVATLGLPALALTAPWALRNWIAGGDPLYPLGLVLQKRAGPPPDVPDHLDHLEVALRTGERSLDALLSELRRLWPSLTPSDHGGEIGRWSRETQVAPHLLAGLPAGLFAVCSPETLLLALFFAGNVAVWFLFSHRVDRFLFPALPLLAVLCGLALERLWQIRAARKLAGIYVLAALLMVAPLAMIFPYSLGRPHALLGDRDPLEAQLAQYEQLGNPSWAKSWRAINALPSGSRVLFIGDAQTAYVRAAAEYHVVFNPALLEEVLALAASPEDAVVLLKARGITHLYFNYAEWLRLDTSYALSRYRRSPWEYAGLGAPERSVLWRFLTARQYALYGKSIPYGVQPAYLKLEARGYNLLEELVRRHSHATRVFYDANGEVVVCELRELRL